MMPSVRLQSRPIYPCKDPCYPLDKTMGESQNVSALREENMMLLLLMLPASAPRFLGNTGHSNVKYY